MHIWVLNGASLETFRVDIMPEKVRWIWGSLDGGSGGELADEGRRCNAGLKFLWSWTLSCPSLSLWLSFLLPCQIAERLYLDFLPSEEPPLLLWWILLFFSPVSFSPSSSSYWGFSCLCLSNARGVRGSDSVDVFMAVDFLGSPPVWFSLWPLLSDVNIYVASFYLIILPLCCSLHPSVPHESAPLSGIICGFNDICLQMWLLSLFL